MGEPDYINKKEQLVMKNLGLFILLSLMVVGLAFSFTASASVRKYVSSSGYVLSWDKKQVILFSQGHRIKVPRKAFGKAQLKRGFYVSNLMYKPADVPGYKKFIKALKKAQPRKPATTK